VSDGLTLSKLRPEHPMLTLIELSYVKKKHEKLTPACKSDTLPALLVWFHHNLAGFSNSNNDFCCFLSVISSSKRKVLEHLAQVKGEFWNRSLK
jgi:hypothetical protein